MTARHTTQKAVVRTVVRTVCTLRAVSATATAARHGSVSRRVELEVVSQHFVKVFLHKDEHVAEGDALHGGRGDSVGRQVEGPLAEKVVCREGAQHLRDAHEERLQ